MKNMIGVALLTTLCVLTGCKSINTDLSQSVFDQRIQDHFHLGMSSESTEQELKKLVIKCFKRDTEVVALIYPQWSPIPGVNSFWETYGQRSVLFDFGTDDALDGVEYEIHIDEWYSIALEPRKCTQ